MDVVLTTELKSGKFLEREGIKIIWLLHGIISNHYPFKKDWTVDLVVSPKLNFTEELKQFSNFPQRGDVFDSVYMKASSLKLIRNNKNIDIFENDNPVVLYNPHWDNRDGLSSFYEHANSILEYFRLNDDYNLIFAPHSNLNFFFGYSDDGKYKDCSNIHIDYSSDNLILGSYFKLANYYLGDVSSQFFEMLLFKEVPSIFIVNKNVDVELFPDYWKKGIIINNIQDLVNIDLEAYSTEYKSCFNHYFNEINDDMNALINRILSL
jgi:hypothetical protein